jgi:transcription initiation factor TFIIH subunit 4
MKKSTPILPETVSDQLRIWETERNRVRFEEGVLYDGFVAEEGYKKALKYAQDNHVYIWGNMQKQLLMVTQEGHELMKPFIKKYCS